MNKLNDVLCGNDVADVLFSRGYLTTIFFLCINQANASVKKSSRKKPMIICS